MSPSGITLTQLLRSRLISCRHKLRMFDSHGVSGRPRPQRGRIFVALPPARRSTPAGSYLKIMSGIALIRIPNSNVVPPLGLGRAGVLLTPRKSKPLCRRLAIEGLDGSEFGVRSSEFGVQNYEPRTSNYELPTSSLTHQLPIVGCSQLGLYVAGNAAVFQEAAGVDSSAL